MSKQLSPLEAGNRLIKATNELLREAFENGNSEN